MARKKTVERDALRIATDAFVAELVALLLDEALESVDAAYANVRKGHPPRPQRQEARRTVAPDRSPDAPPSPSDLGEVLREFNSYRFKPARVVDERVVAVIANLRSTAGLTSSECATLLLTIHGATREDICRVKSRTRNAVKTHVRKLLKKIGEEELDDAALTILRASLLVEKTSVRAPATTARQRVRPLASF